jgi:Zn-dependent protease
MFGDLNGTYLLVVIISILVSLTLHEAMHAFAAHALGDSTARDEGRLTLNPLKHVDLLFTVALPVVMIMLGLPPLLIAKPVPFDPDRVKYGELGAALVALAGPFTNLAIAALTSLVIRFGGVESLDQVLVIFLQLNIVFFVFNMIPFPPLDGSRLLYAFAPQPLQRVMLQIESAGLGITILIFLLLSPFILPLVSNISSAIYSFLLAGV